MERKILWSLVAVAAIVGALWTLAANNFLLWFGLVIDVGALMAAAVLIRAGST